MNLTLHQFRIEMLRFRAALALWCATLLVDLAFMMGWIGRPTLQMTGGAGGQLHQWAGSGIEMVYWLLLAMLPIWVALEDSPARRDRFMATRPMPARDMLRAKTLFILTCILLPLVLQEIVYLVLQGVSPGIVLRGALERMLFMMVYVTAFAAFASLWANFQQLTVAAGATFGAGVAFCFGVEIVQWLFHCRIPSPDLDNNPVLLLVTGTVVTTGLVCLAVLNARRGWGIRNRSVGVAVTGAVGLAVLWGWPGGLFQVRPANPAQAALVNAKAAFRVPVNALSIYCEDKQVQFHVAPRMDGLPPQDFVIWGMKQMDACWQDGTKLPLKLQRNAGNMLWRYESGMAFEDMRCLGSLLPNDPDWVSQEHLFPSGRPAGPAMMTEPVARGREDAPFVLRGELEGQVCAWEIVADLPFETGAKARMEQGRCRIECIDLDSKPEIDVGLLMEHVQLSLSRDQDCSSIDGGAASRYLYALYLPEKGLILNAAYQSYRAVLGQRTAWIRRTVWLPFRFNGNFTSMTSREDLRKARLIVFQRRWLGGVTHAWTSPPMTWREMAAAPAYYRNEVLQGERLSMSEFYRRLSAFPALGPDCSRAEAGRYLAGMLKLVEMREDMADEFEPVVRQTSLLVSNHLDLLLEAAAVCDYRGNHVLTKALIQGLEERQKAAIIAAMKNVPVLADVTWERGWVGDARDELLRLAQRPGNMLANSGVFNAVAFLQEPSTYQALLDVFEHDGSESQYNRLCLLPGIEPALSATLDRMWENRPRSRSDGYEWVNSMMLQARHGKMEAFRLLYEWKTRFPNDQYESQQIRMSLPKLIHWTSRKPVDEWDHAKWDALLKQHRAGDFQYDPARHGFVLKQGE